MTIEITGYCLKCKAHRPIVNVHAVWLKNGAPAQKGQCAVCNTTISKMGRVAEHDSLPKPEIVEKETTTAKEKKSAEKPTKKAPAKSAKAATTATKSKSSKTTKKISETSRSNKPKVRYDGPLSGKLVIVESPAKAKTINKYLGKGYTVKSSVGHVRDLLKSRLSVDLDNNYAPEYRVPNEKRKVVQELAEAAARAKEIYLATDPDREGEAIAWHVMESAEMDPKRTRRVVFHEITEAAVKEALAHPRAIDMQRVDAQQARRILDRLVGYKLSPLLWRKVKGRLSAGRVQSVAVRLVVEREREITQFEPQEYWTLQAELIQNQPKAVKFRANWVKYEGKEPLLHTEADVLPHLEQLKAAQWQVEKVKIGTRQRRPAPPFTTSTLQQEASRRLGFGTSKTMKVAQQLYEGVDIGTAGTVGLITYMRTDSLNVSSVAQAEAREWVKQKHGDAFLPEKPPFYKTNSKSAQEAHEAIRPTSVFRLPVAVKEKLSRDQYRLYELIWLRFLASQMAPAVYNTVAVDISADLSSVPPNKRRYLFRSTGSTLKFAGFLALYEETAPSDRPDDDAHPIPDTLQEGELLNVLRLLPEQHFTQPPPRYTEATLVKMLDENGIGRPSTYASIITTIQDRGYVEKEEKKLVPTPVGEVVTDMLVESFPDVLSVDFTAQMEDELDKIADGSAEWVKVVDSFYQPFYDRLAIADATLPKMEMKTEPEYVGRDCPTCEVGQLVYRDSRFGRFIGCNRFPTCRYTEKILKTTGVVCPLHSGQIVEQRTRKGRIFYGCSHYPQCEWTSWNKPVGVTEKGILVEAGKQGQKETMCGLKVGAELEAVAAD